MKDRPLLKFFRSFQKEAVDVNPSAGPTFPADLEIDGMKLRIRADGRIDGDIEAVADFLRTLSDSSFPSQLLALPLMLSVERERRKAERVKPPPSLGDVTGTSKPSRSPEPTLSMVRAAIDTFGMQPSYNAMRRALRAALAAAPEPSSAEKRFREALERIAVGEGYYGAQAYEYKQIAREALSNPEGAHHG